jgi:pectin methylesterase-like acyl-CoA thioesterase
MSIIGRRLALATLTALAAPSLMPSPANADPRGDLVVNVVCDDGNTYTTVSRAAQNFNAQLVTDSTSVFLLTQYDFNVRVTAEDGTLVFEGSFPAIERGDSANRQRRNLTCSYDYTADRGDGTTVHAWGTLRGYVTPLG